MYFARTSVDRLDAAAPPVYLPRNAVPVSELSPDEYTAIQVEGVGELRALSRLVRMALLFNEGHNWRQQASHDCGVFALACAMDDPLYGMEFGPDGPRLSFPELRVEPLDEADPSTFGRSPADIVSSYTVATQNLPDDMVMVTRNSMHLQVRATHPDDAPLYFSKFGPPGLVLLHPLEAGLTAYPADTICEVGRPFLNGVQV